MKELIKITEQNGKRAVSARELHQFLEVETRFNDWISRMLQYGFSKNIDYQAVSVLLKNEYNSKGGRPETDYALTIDTAKEIAMIQRTPKGKQARQYFIEMEKQALSKMINTNYLQRVDKNAVSAKRLEVVNEIRNYLRWGDMSKVAKELKIDDRFVKIVATGQGFNTEHADNVLKALYERALANKKMTLFTYQEMIDTLKS